MNFWGRARTKIQTLRSNISKMPEWVQNRLGLGSVAVRVGGDDRGWSSLTRPGGPADRPWGELQQDLYDVLEAWRKNFLIRQIVRLTTAYVVGDGVRITSEIPAVDSFIQAFWNHPENRLQTRLPGMCDELTRSGELFPVLFTNRFDGMSQLRLAPASCIVGIETDPEDYEKELSYEEAAAYRGGGVATRVWKSRRTARTPRLTPPPTPPRYGEGSQGQGRTSRYGEGSQGRGSDFGNGERSQGRGGPPSNSPAAGGAETPAARPQASPRRYKPEPMMLHYAINKPVGAVRGEGDLVPVLPWALRYTEWLKDRVRFNRLRTELAAVDIEIDDDSKVGEKRQQYEANPPIGGSITVHGRGEKITYPSANIQGFEAEPDGRALRLAFAAGANVPLHFLAEGSSATRSTASEMGDPTHRHYRMRQQDFAGFLVDLCACAWRRYEAVNGLAPLEDLAIKAVLPDISRADNEALANAANAMVSALAQMKQNGWVTDAWAVEMAFKFAGEALTQEEIMGILGKNDE